MYVTKRAILWKMVCFKHGDFSHSVQMGIDLTDSWNLMWELCICSICTIEGLRVNVLEELVLNYNFIWVKKTGWKVFSVFLLYLKCGVNGTSS